MSERDDLLRRAHGLLVQKDYNGVVTTLADWVESQPDDAGAWQLIAAAYLQLGLWEEARQATEHVVNLRPDEARAWSNWGTTLRKLGQSDQARYAQEQALQISPGYERAQTELRKLAGAAARPAPVAAPPPATGGLAGDDHVEGPPGPVVGGASELAEDHSGAHPCPVCGEWLADAARCCDACLANAASMINAGNPDGALEILASLHQNWPESADLLYTIGTAYEAKGDDDTAGQFYEAGTVRDPAAAAKHQPASPPQPTEAPARVEAETPISTGQWVGFAVLGCIGGLVAVIAAGVWAFVTQEKSKRRLAWWTMAWGAPSTVLTIIVVAALPGALGGGRAKATPAQQGGAPATGITLEQYNRVEPGMREQEVVNILGPGREISRTPEPGGTAVTYTWPGQAGPQASATIMFSNGAVNQKSQVGLQ